MNTMIRYVGGVEGNSFHIGDIRVAGPKAWGGGRVLAERKTTVKDILYALNNIYKPSHQPLKSAEEEAKALLYNIGVEQTPSNPAPEHKS